MKKLFNIILTLYFLSLANNIFSQNINISELCNLSNSIQESSGLVYFNNRLFTLNDSGNSPYLYEIDTASGNILRSIFISNASNTDWEDLAQDSLYFYIADIGNNNGNRTNLRIYRVLKNEVLQDDTVLAESINFYYEDQSDFSSNPQNTEYDAEALICAGNSLYIFTKDWTVNKSKLYKIPKQVGNQVAILKDSINTAGLITSADINTFTNKIALTGYTSLLKPFVYIIDNFDNNNFFSGNIHYYNLNDYIQANQIEAVSFINDDKMFLSSEKFAYNDYSIPPKLFRLYLNPNVFVDYTKTAKIKLYPNPAKNILHLNVKSYVEIYDISGKKILSGNSNNIDISTLTNGLYIIKIHEKNKIIKLKFIVN